MRASTARLTMLAVVVSTVNALTGIDQARLWLPRRTPACRVLHQSERRSCDAAPRSRTPLMLKELTKRDWCENIDGAEKLSVVLFYARWCRTCKAVTPVYKRVEREYPQANFFKVNFKAETELCYNERVFSFPSVHFYLPGFGRVSRIVLTKDEADARLREMLDRFLGGSDGQQAAQIDLLRRCSVEMLRPVVCNSAPRRPIA